MRARAWLAALAGVLCIAAASDPAERLTDPAQEARARVLFKDLRCLVCQNESIDDSEAAFAADLRRVVREQVAAGRSDAEIHRFLTARYGDYILLKPPFSPASAILWLGPFAAVLVGGVLLILRVRRRPEEATLTPEEEAELAALLKNKAD